METVKNIAIITFDSKDTDLIEWSYFNKKVLTPHNILALGYAGNILEGTLNKKIERSGLSKSGESRYLCNLIKEEKIDAVLIFGEDDIFENKELSSVFKEAHRNNIVVAANRTTADFIIHSFLLNNGYAISKKEKKLIEEEAQAVNAPFAFAKAS